MGPFNISQLDARRLREGMRHLEPERAARVRERARQSWSRIAADFPGDPATGLLDEGEEAKRRFETFADDEPCPALDPQTGLCDLYAARPITCRTFGPPVRCGPDSLGACELCYQGASDAEIAACEVELDHGNLEAELLRDIEPSGETIVAFVLAA